MPGPSQATVVPWVQVLWAEAIDGQVTISYLAPKTSQDNNELRLDTLTGIALPGTQPGATEDWCEAALSKAYDGQSDTDRSSEPFNDDWC